MSFCKRAGNWRTPRRLGSGRQCACVPVPSMGPNQCAAFAGTPFPRSLDGRRPQNDALETKQNCPSLHSRSVVLKLPVRVLPSLETSCPAKADLSSAAGRRGRRQLKSGFWFASMPVFSESQGSQFLVTFQWTIPERCMSSATYLLLFSFKNS